MKADLLPARGEHATTLTPLQKMVKNNEDTSSTSTKERLFSLETVVQEASGSSSPAEALSVWC